MSQQTTYSDQMTAAFAGMKASMVNDTVASYCSEESSAEMPFGKMLVQGAADSGAKLPSAASDNQIGVLLHSHQYAQPTELGTTGVKPKSMLNVLTQGQVWVTVEEAVTPASDVHCRYATGSGSLGLGSFRATAVGGETFDVTNQCRYLTSASLGGLALLEVNMANRI